MCRHTKIERGRDDSRPFGLSLSLVFSSQTRGVLSEGVAYKSHQKHLYTLKHIQKLNVRRDRIADTNRDGGDGAVRMRVHFHDCEDTK